jgi:hypothetical protein
MPNRRFPSSSNINGGKNQLKMNFAELRMDSCDGEFLSNLSMIRRIDFSKVELQIIYSHPPMNQTRKILESLESLKATNCFQPHSNLIELIISSEKLSNDYFISRNN